MSSKLAILEATINTSSGNRYYTGNIIGNNLPLVVIGNILTVLEVTVNHKK